jgi:GMP synthase-like glutamine amidotransferase
MRPLLVIHHLEPPAMGRAAAILDAAGLTFDERLISAGEPLPALEEVAGILSLGGRESVTELDRYPYLVEEVRLLREAVEADVPVLGVCLGGQLLAHALGGSVRRAPAREIRWFGAERLPAADGDPLFGGLPQTVTFVRWNEDAFELPPGGVELLRRTGAGADAFRFGEAAWGVQFHPELDGDMLDGWYAAYPGTLRQAGVSEVDARAADAVHDPAQASLADALFGAFAGIVRAREPAAAS